MSPLLTVKNLTKHFPVSHRLFFAGKKRLRALDGISFEVAEGETLGIVGESGSGKSTAARTILRLIEPTGGEVIFDGQDIMKLQGETLRKFRKNAQMIFQDPYASLNPRLTIGEIIEEPMKYHGFDDHTDRKEKVMSLLREVGLHPDYHARFPFQFSGGQRQRIGIARALSLQPRLIIADEPVSALDVSVQAQILNLFMDLQYVHKFTYIFIAHDLSVVKHISNRIAVMYLGEIVEIAEKHELFKNPLHPYTQALISAIPEPNPLKKRSRIILTGDIPSPIDVPKGCRFYSRCRFCTVLCRDERPKPFEKNGHKTLCHLYH
ncbi:oligopeptide transport ATP-binding protein AppF [Treponema primitia ZAS-2]|uniref:Oligopeptide transport ATP-binding protein AppF n=1 Tax=Treponema primitia (strain ATCC BAA-887 / DSM 12427 / ZAS-2) TaxID=545694 RepID=F5YM04_TREPZ|nr:oligopeptide/dipeptide ABC transporter ATP-binding protein [Treponema primitia]AEF84642.1 oligopeptide transport ATP-binding protein AppF [Treponema primitia ZAS-2]